MAHRRTVQLASPKHGSHGVVYLAGDLAYKVSITSVLGALEEECARHLLIWQRHDADLVHIPQPGTYYSNAAELEKKENVKLEGMSDEERLNPLYWMQRMLPLPLEQVRKVLPDKDEPCILRLTSASILPGWEDDEPSVGIEDARCLLAVPTDAVMFELGRFVELLQWTLKLDASDVEVLLTEGAVVFVADFSGVNKLVSVEQASEALFLTSIAKGSFPRDKGTRELGAFGLGYMAAGQAEGGERLKHATEVLELYMQEVEQS